MSNELGDDYRAAFLATLEAAGTDCQVSGQTLRALVKADQQAGVTSFKFADEFPVGAGTPLKDLASGITYSVVQGRPVAVAGSYQCFQVTAKHTSA